MLKIKLNKKEVALKKKLQKQDLMKDVFGIDRHSYGKKMCGKWKQNVELKELLTCLTCMTVQP